MSPQQLAGATVDLVAEVTRTCAQLELQPFSVSVQWWSFSGPEVNVQMRGTDSAAVDALVGAYGITAQASPEGQNYTRTGPITIGKRNVRLTSYTGRPTDRMTLIRAWVAANYSDESKYRVANGEEATSEDQAKIAAAEAAGAFEVSA